MPTFDSRHDFTTEPLTSAAPQISTPWLGQVHTLPAEPLATQPPALGVEPPPDPGVHRLKAAPSRRPSNRDSPRIRLIQTVLRQGVPEWSERSRLSKRCRTRGFKSKGKRRLERIRGPAVRGGSGIKYASLSCELWAERSGNNWSRDQSIPLRSADFLIHRIICTSTSKSVGGGGSGQYRSPGDGSPVWRLVHHRGMVQAPPRVNLHVL